MQYDTLIQAGIDMDSLLNRLMGNASLIRMFLRKFLQDRTFESLKAAFAAGDLRGAEMASHTLKGMCGNLSLTVLYQLFTRQTSLLRAGDAAEAEAMMPEIACHYRQATDNMTAFLAQG